VPPEPSTPGWKIVAMIAAVWLLSLPAAEIAFRLAGDRVVNDGFGLFMPFGDRSYKMAPNAVSDFNLIQGRSVVYTNSLGLRCGAQGRTWIPGPTDLLIIGDSQSFGWGLNFESTMIGQLAAIAGRDGLSVQNAAIGGQYLSNEFELLQWLYAQGVRPKRIAVLLTPYLIATAGSYNRAAVGSDGRLYDSVAQARRIGGLTTWLKMHVVVYPRLRAAALAALPTSKAKEDPFALKIFRRDKTVEFLSKTLADVDRIRAWAAERGIGVTLGYAPLAAEYEFAPIAQAARDRKIAIDKDVPASVAAEVATRLNAKFVDLRPAIAGESAAGHKLTLTGDPHYNEKTSAIVAKALYAGLFEGVGGVRN
jgi:hypothetical protein